MPHPIHMLPSWLLPCSRSTPERKLSLQRYQPPTADPFARRSVSSTAFTTLYNAGGIPARVDHGTAKMR
jgi:hypothetical protein